MLSKKEKEYLEGNLTITRNYEQKLIYTIRKKLKNFYQHELPLIEPKLEQIQGKSGNLGKLTSYQAKLTPPAIIISTMIKYLNCQLKTWMHDALNVKNLLF